MEPPATFIDGTKVVFSNKNVIDFKARVLQILQMREILIIIPLHSPAIHDANNENVYAFSLQGDFLWRLETKGTSFAGYAANEECKFIGAKSDSNGDLILFNWCDFAFRVNASDGSVLERIQTWK